MARRTKEEAQETREKILEAASHVFIHRGVSKASLEEIAATAGVTRGAVYWHFKNKNDVFLALHDRLHIPFTEMVLNDLEKDHPEPLAQLEELCIRLLLDVEEISEKKRILTILFLKCEYAGEMEGILEKQNQRRAKNFRLFDQYFERAKQKGHLSRQTEVHILTVSLFCYLTGIVMESIRDPKAFSLKQQARGLVRQFFLGLGRKGVKRTG